MFLFHVTTEKKAKSYRESGEIHNPVRGFDSLPAAMFWAMKTGRKVIYKIECEESKTHKLPDHHNDFGNAFWTESKISYERIKCVASAT
jgi:hypothetical protein